MFPKSTFCTDAAHWQKYLDDKGLNLWLRYHLTLAGDALWCEKLQQCESNTRRERNVTRKCSVTFLAWQASSNPSPDYYISSGRKCHPEGSRRGDRGLTHYRELLWKCWENPDGPWIYKHTCPHTQRGFCVFKKGFLCTKEITFWILWLGFESMWTLVALDIEM